ncbi:MAG: GNAT family N-acetyltransferase [Bacteroidetes bacterium]|nr:MAG: GNAT family N-acetyltransferase [Bacteroidota bacterium]
MQDEIREQLSKNLLQNLPVIGFFENYPLEETLVHGKSMILTGTSDYTWAYLAVPDENEMSTLLDKFEFKSLYFANVEEWMLPHLTRNHRIEWRLNTHRYYLPDNVEPGAPELDCRALNKDLVNYIYLNSPYKDYTSEAYIRERIKKDISAGVWIDYELAGWGLTHDDSSLGFLNVLSQYRGQGLGENIFRSLIQGKREKQKSVFVNVEPHNKQSINLLNKLGLKFDRQVSWLKLV